VGKYLFWGLADAIKPMLTRFLLISAGKSFEKIIEGYPRFGRNLSMHHGRDRLGIRKGDREMAHAVPSYRDHLNGRASRLTRMRYRKKGNQRAAYWSMATIDEENTT
jgi:hypothetical protein